MEILREKIIQRLTEDGAVQPFQLFVWWKESTMATGTLHDEFETLDLQYVFETANDLGLASWVRTERPDIEEPGEPETSTDRHVLNAELKWAVELHSPDQLAMLPMKIPHSGNYEWAGQERTGSPRYLWDSKHSQTVLATQERLQQGYIAVSYTWGRFKERYDRVNGTPWNVPVIKPNVFGDMLDRLKGIMAAIPACRYFWVDVLCINQDDMNQKKEEIAKQASIFGGAKACLSYLWSLDFDDDLAHIMSSFGDQLLWSLVLSTSDFRCNQSQLNGLEKLPSYIQEKLDAKLRLDPWFTSLWAVQETVLAPAQVWMTKSGSFCSVNGSLVTTHLFAQALQLMDWAAGFRRRMWDFALVGKYPLLEGWEAALASSNIVDRHRTKQDESWKSWEESMTEKQRKTAEMRVKDICIMDVVMGDQGVRNLPENLQERQADEIIGSKALKRWLDWGFGEASLNISLQASRSAIIVAGANRHTSKPRKEAMLAALKIGQDPEQDIPDENLTPGALPGWLQQILVVIESSIYFYVSHSWRSISERRAGSSPLFVEHASWLAYDNIHKGSAPAIPAAMSDHLTSLLPSLGTRSFLPTDFSLKHYSAISMSAWHIHDDGVMHIPYGAAIQDIRSGDQGRMTILTNGPAHEFNSNLTHAVRAIQELDFVKGYLGRRCRVIFLPLLYIGNPTAGLPRGSSHTLTSTGPNPVVRGIVLVSRPSSKRHHSMTFWSKAGLYSATLCRVKILDWQDGILVGSALEESAASRDKERCLINLCNKPYLWGPKVKWRLFDND